MPKETFMVEVSARHVHLCAKDVETLFGTGYKLTKKRDLSQVGEFLANERVDISGPKGTFKGVAILGPERPASQVEVSVTDSYTLGIKVPVRESGDLERTAGLRLTGLLCSVELNEGLIVAKRHIHMTPEQALRFNVKDKQTVYVMVNTDRPVAFGGVVVRVKPSFALAMHVDTDEANAAAIPREGAQGYIIPSLE